MVDEDLLSRPVEGFTGLLDQQVEVDGPDLVAALAGIAQKLGREPGAALDLFLDAFEPLVEGVFQVQVEEHERDVPLDDHEEVVEVMGDAAGQGAHGLHLLGVVELGLDLLALAHVVEHHDEGPLHVVADRQELDHELPVVELHGTVGCHDTRLGRHAVDHLPHQVLVPAGEEAEHARGQKPLLGNAGEGDGRGVGKDDAAPRSDLQDALGEASQHTLVVLPDGEQLLCDLPRVEVLDAEDALLHVPRAPVLGIVERGSDILAHFAQRSLGDAGIGPDGPEVELLLGGGGREDDEVGVLHLGHGPDDLAELLAVDIGHDEIHEDDVGAVGLQNIQGVQAILGDADLVPDLAQELGHVLQDDRVVVHDEDFFLFHAAHPFVSGPTGLAPRTAFLPSRFAWYKNSSACSIN